MTQPTEPPRRRARPRGAGGSGWTPMPSSSSRDEAEEDRSLDREIDKLQAVLRERGELSHGELGDAVGGRYWGPGRFARALREAVRRRAITSPVRRRYSAG